MNVCKRIRHPLALRPADRSVEEQELIEAHLASCPNCAARARAYAEQDRLIRSVPRVGLTPSQRGQLLSRIQRERRRHKMRINLSTVLSTAVGLVVLTVVGFGVRVLLSQSGQPSPGTPSVQYPTDEATPLTTTKLIFADEIGLEQVSDSLTGQVIPFTPGDPDSSDSSVSGRLTPQGCSVLHHSSIIQDVVQVHAVVE
jgi:hypothetical protein